MIKDKLEKCADTSNNIQIKEEPTSSCDSTSKETGGNEPAIPIKEEDAPSSSTASTANVKESPGSRGTGTVSSRPNSSSNANAGPTTNGNNSNPVCPTTNAPPPMGVGHPAALPAVPDPTDVTSILDSASDVVVPPGGPGGIPDETVINDRTPLPPDLQTDTFNELGPSNMPPNMRQPGMIQPQQPHNIRPSPNGIQPLVSNVINKTQQATGGNNMEVQYMQQQSQIFVFSTMLANKSADAVFQGHFQSIIAYHCAQPGTKKYFEKHPLKLTQFHRQNPAQWLNGLAMMKNKGCARGGGNMGGGGGPQQGPPGGMPGLPNFPPKPGGGSMGMVDNFPGHDGIVDDIASLQESDVPWEQRPNHQMGMPVPPNAGPDGTGPLSDPSLDDACLAGTSTAPGAPGNANTALMLGHSPCITSTAPTSPSLAGLEPSLQGVKVPDEDLTPQQRQHREEQLATLRKMQQMLFPEENTGAMNIGDEHEMGGNATDTPGGGPPGNCPGMMPATSMPGHMEWQKLQNQFFDSKIKQEGPIGPGLRGMVPMPPGLPPGSGSVLSPQVPGSGQGPRLQGPPPPYHQTPRSASVPIALQSPSPASPNNPTSNLSLPSPRTSSALNSPADSNNRQQFSGLNRHFSATQSPTSQSSPSGPSGGPRGTNTISNPGTPISSHFSPSATTPATDSLTVQASSGNGGTSSEFTGAGGPGVVTSTHHGVDGMFCRTLQSMAQKQHMVSGVPPGSTDISGSPNKEPNLMPVPSPQQIQYCNTFEGQELTIQKQPNTSLKDRNITSPPSLESGFPGEMCSGGGNNGTRVSAPNTPLTPSSVDMGPRFPINTTNPQSDCYRLPAPSPNSIDSKNPRPSPQGPGNPRPSNDPNNMKSNNPEANNVRFSNASPLDGHNRYPIMGVGGSPNAFAQQQQQQQQKPQQPPGGNPGGGNMMAVSPSGKANDIPISTSGQRADNVPLNPNSNNGLPGNPKGSHFDPISSLAQMSQLLTSTSSLNGQPPGSGPSMMPYGGVNASPMDMGRPDMGCVPDLDGGMMGMGPGGPHVYNSGSIGSPKNMPFMSPQRIMRPQMGQMPPYNGTNVQVKASAPNTIQYLPARPQMGPQNPRGPPCLEFLRFANPNMDGKNIGAQNMQYFPGCGPSNNMGHMEGGGGPMHNDGIMASLMNGPPMMGKMGPMSGGMVPQGMMPMGMGGGPNMRNPGGPGGLRPGMNPSIRMHGGMGGFDSSGLGGDGMYPPSGPGGPQMFGPGMGGPKGPMGRGMCAPDASQPLPPSVGQTNAYKSSPFGAGATTADPNYAQQFHNFQQQLYATSTRSQLNSQGPGPPQGPPQGGPPGMYFMSK